MQQTPLGHRSAPMAGASGEIQALLLEAGARRASEPGAGCPRPHPLLTPSLFQTLGSRWSGSRRHFLRN